MGLYWNWYRVSSTRWSCFRTGLHTVCYTNGSPSQYTSHTTQVCARCGRYTVEYYDLFGWIHTIILAAPPH